MDKSKSNDAKYVNRHLSQLKILTRLMEHELDTAKGDTVTLDRELTESMLDTIEIFVEDVERGGGGDAEAGGGRRERKQSNGEKPAVTRLN